MGTLDDERRYVLRNDVLKKHMNSDLTVLAAITKPEIRYKSDQIINCVHVLSLSYSLILWNGFIFY